MARSYPDNGGAVCYFGDAIPGYGVGVIDGLHVPLCVVAFAVMACLFALSRILSRGVYFNIEMRTPGEDYASSDEESDTEDEEEEEEGEEEGEREEEGEWTDNEQEHRVPATYKLSDAEGSDSSEPAVPMDDIDRYSDEDDAAPMPSVDPFRAATKRRRLARADSKPCRAASDATKGRDPICTGGSCKLRRQQPPCVCACEGKPMPEDSVAPQVGQTSAEDTTTKKE